MSHSIIDILEKWPSRAAVHEDAQAANPDLKMIAVHRWFQRGSVPVSYLSALANGAKRRRLKVSVTDLVEAYSGHDDQGGHISRKSQQTAGCGGAAK